MPDIREKDWKIVRSLKDAVLDRACQRILEKVSTIIATDDKSAHTRYLELWKTLKTEDKDIAFMFDNLRRSTALQQLARWKFNNLVTDEEMKSFSDGTLEKVNAFMQVWR
ncbi:MAG: hypothetical protein R6U13_09045 [Desulfatiglandaceae bacterium]